MNEDESIQYRPAFSNLTQSEQGRYRYTPYKEPDPINLDAYVRGQHEAYWEDWWRVDQ